MWQVDVHQAAINGKMAELELVAEYAPERINKPTYSSWQTPLHYAARYDQEAAVRFLLSAGANVNQTSNSGRTPHSYAHSARVEKLLRHAAGR